MESNGFHGFKLSRMEWSISDWEIEITGEDSNSETRELKKKLKPNPFQNHKKLKGNKYEKKR